jgi:hypothetical protein
MFQDRNMRTLNMAREFDMVSRTLRNDFIAGCGDAESVARDVVLMYEEENEKEAESNMKVCENDGI